MNGGDLRPCAASGLRESTKPSRFSHTFHSIERTSETGRANLPFPSVLRSDARWRSGTAGMGPRAAVRVDLGTAFAIESRGGKPSLSVSAVDRARRLKQPGSSPETGNPLPDVTPARPFRRSGLGATDHQSRHKHQRHEELTKISAMHRSILLAAERPAP